jgi:hypothetical protein
LGPKAVPEVDSAKNEKKVDVLPQNLAEMINQTADAVLRDVVLEEQTRMGS